MSDRESTNVEAAAWLAREEQQRPNMRVGGLRVDAEDVPTRAELAEEKRP